MLWGYPQRWMVCFFVLLVYGLMGSEVYAESVEDFYTQRINDQMRSWQLVPIESSLNDNLFLGVDQLEGDDVSQHFRILVNIPARKVFLFEDEEIIKTYQIAVGTREFKTPVSHMTLKHIVWNPSWYPPDEEWAAEEEITPPGPGNPLGPVKMPMQQAIMFHGTNQPTSVGQASSHGCMRMKNREAIELAWFLQERLSQKSERKYLTTYKRHRYQTYHVRLDQAVPVDLVYDRLQPEGQTLVMHPDIYNMDYRGHYQVENHLKSLGLDEQDIDQDKIYELVRSNRQRTVSMDVSELIAPSHIVEEFFKPLDRSARIADEPVRPSNVPPPLSVSGPYSFPIVN
jgi:hypothetical protein